ncbi:MAG: hypothetical protein K2Y23_17125 [Cyanobacteria bacterium]|nr:hypothetical protein [Cyanobacteriota bacterium]
MTADIDRLIEYFNKRKLDLPDGFFDRRTQFVINGAPFETLLGRDPNDPLILMLARGPAGYRFTIKALQHAITDAKLEKIDVSPDSSAVTLRLTGTLRGTNASVNAIVPIALKLAPAGHIEVAEATIDAATLDKIREARLRP